MSKEVYIRESNNYSADKLVNWKKMHYQYKIP